MSTLRVNTIQDASGGSNLSVPGAARAWVRFNGTGTVAIDSQLGVSSITDNGTGNYTVNFATAFGSTNYSYIAQPHTSLSAAYHYVPQTLSVTTSGVQFLCQSEGAAGGRDSANISVSVFN